MARFQPFAFVAALFRSSAPAAQAVDKRRPASPAHVKGWETRRARRAAQVRNHCAALRASMETQDK